MIEEARNHLLVHLKEIDTEDLICGLPFGANEGEDVVSKLFGRQSNEGLLAEVKFLGDEMNSEGELSADTFASACSRNLLTAACRQLSPPLLAEF